MPNAINRLIPEASVSDKDREPITFELAENAGVVESWYSLALAFGRSSERLGDVIAKVSELFKHREEPMMGDFVHCIIATIDRAADDIEALNAGELPLG